MYQVRNIEVLREELRKAKAIRTYNRLQALNMLYCDIDTDKICEVCGVYVTTLLYTWLPNWNELGIDGLLDEPRTGRPSLINSKQKEKLREYVLSKDGRIVCKDLARYVKSQWDIDADEETIRKVLKSMKLSWQKPNKENYKGDEEEKKVFLKSFGWHKG